MEQLNFIEFHNIMKIVTLSQLGKGKDSLVSRNVWIPAARPAPRNSKAVYNQHQYAPFKCADETSSPIATAGLKQPPEIHPPA